MGGLIGAFSAGCSLIFAAQIGGAASSILYGTVAAMAIIAGIVSAVYGARTKTALEAAKDAASAWKEERDAEVAKAERLTEQLRTESANRKAAEARTDLTRVEAMLVDQHREALAILTAIKDTLQILAASR